MFKDKVKKLMPDFLVSFYHWLWAFVGALFYGFPSSYIKIIGVTGTNGKSTVVHLITEILEKAGFKVASASSLEFRIGEERKQNELKMTMPGRGYLHKFLRRAIRNECDYAVIEVTSEGIKQHRQRFIKFDAAVFTNLTPEHIESHGSFEAYQKAKGKLWKQLAEDGVSVVNLDDEHSDYFWNFPAGEKYGYSLNKEAAVKAENIEVKEDSSEFEIEDVEFELSLPGEFNVSNALAAVGVGLSQDVSLKTCKNALQQVKGIPGRMEVVTEEPFKVVVDYAHTPDALREVYNSLNEDLICVLGSCGGGRDKWKRPELGEIADKHCSKIILTNEDPYSEDPRKIVEEVEKGVEDKEAEIVLDREEAIETALGQAEPGQTVVITGKGAEPLMCVADGKIPWDDREIVKEKLNSSKDEKVGPQSNK